MEEKGEYTMKNYIGYLIKYNRLKGIIPKKDYVKEFVLYHI